MHLYFPKLSSFVVINIFNKRDVLLSGNLFGNNNLYFQRFSSKSILLQKLIFFINTQSSNSSVRVRNFWICLSSSKTCQLFTLSGIKGLCLTSISYFPTGCIGTLKVVAEVARESATQFCTLEIRLKIHSSKHSLSSKA